MHRKGVGIKMKKRFWLFSLLAVTLFLTGCQANAEDAVPVNNEPSEADPAAVVMEATVAELGERILVEVTKSEYTSGPHLVIINEETAIKDAEGNTIRASDIRVGDHLRIVYSGQVMLSYPPQIVAHSITVY